jgi:hypothetical protein
MRVLSQIQKQKSELLDVSKKAPKESFQMFSRVKSFFSGGGIQNELRSQKTNLRVLENKYETLYLSFLESNEDYLQVRTKTHYYKYKIQRNIAVVMFILGIQRIISTIITLLRGRAGSKTDIVVLIVSHTLKVFNLKLTNEEYQELVDNVYFAFFGILVLTNINGFVQNFFKFINFIFKSNVGRFISNGTILLFTAEVIGVYIISSFYMIIYKISGNYTGNPHK